MSVSVSVIMPSLNVVDYIETCMDSVINQTLKDIEIICVDGGSTDGTLEILERYSHLDNRIKIVQSNEKSYGYQVNKGVQLAQGEYIAILETDDYIAKDMYEKLYIQAKKYSLDIIKADFYNHYCTDYGFYNIESHSNNQLNVEYNKPYLYSEIPHIVLYDANIWKGIYKKSFLKTNNIELNNSKGAAFQDIGFLIQLSYANPKIMYISDALYYYRSARVGASSTSKNALLYVSQEWDYLKCKGVLSDALQCTLYAYARLIKCFVYEYNKLLEMCDFQSNQGCISDYYDTFEIEIREVLRKYPSIIDLVEDDEVYNIFDKNEQYIDKKKLSYEMKKENINIIEKTIEKKPILIFGCGKYGKNVRRTLLNYNIGPILMCDNNEKLWGEVFESTAIERPDKVIPNFEGSIIIANKNNYYEIEQQVKRYSNDINIIDAREILKYVL